MKKTPFRVQIDEEVQKTLHDIGSRYNLSGNAILAAAASELARIKPENLWHALGRIADADSPPALAPSKAPQIARNRAQTAELIPV